MLLTHPVRLIRWHVVRSALAALLVALLSTAPGAMVIPARAEVATGAVPTSHHHTPASTPGDHQHTAPNDCCSLCVTSCIVCGAMACGGEGYQTPRATTFRRAEHAVARGRNVDLSFSHRFPPSLGPPR